MPKTAYYPEDHKDSGIDITWTKSKQRLDIGGFYDSFVGIKPTSVSLRKFFDQLGITLKDCQKAFKDEAE